MDARLYEKEKKAIIEERIKAKEEMAKERLLRDEFNAEQRRIKQEMSKETKRLIRLEAWRGSAGMGPEFYFSLSRLHSR